MTYTLYQGDCLDILPTLAAGSVDAVITDPPYGTTACSWDSVIPFEPMWAGIKHVLKPRGAAVLFGSQPFTSALVMSNVEWFKYEWVWEKSHVTGIMNARYRPLKIHENILVFSDAMAAPNQFSENKMIYNPQGVTRQNKKAIGKNKPSAINNIRATAGIYIAEFANYPNTIVRSHRLEEQLHPTQKPVTLMEYLIRTYTNPGDTVLDFTMGSGTTGAACMKTGRNFIGIELDADYFRIAETRIKNAAGEFVRTDKERNVGQLALFGD